MINREEHIQKLSEFIKARMLGTAIECVHFRSVDPMSFPSSEGGSRKRESVPFKESAPSEACFSEDALCDSVEMLCLEPESKPLADVSHDVPAMPKASMPVHSSKSRSVKNKAPITSAISSFVKERFEDSAVAKKLNYYMHAKDITTAMIYERCYIDRKLVSKITNRGNYHPSKSTMLALCIGLQLNRNEAEEFLALAGYSFTNTSKSDLIFEYMITNEIYDLRFINEMLEQYDQPIMGA